jgi:hypothetical protein
VKTDGDKPSRGPPPDDRRRRSATPRSNAAADDGRSGYGSDSVRPYLRALLRRKELMQAPQLGGDLALEKPRKR